MNRLSQQKIQNIIDTGNTLGIVDYSILEKDLFVTKVLHVISEISHPQFNLFFAAELV